MLLRRGSEALRLLCGRSLPGVELLLTFSVFRF